jgi:hypothetical protein
MQEELVADAIVAHPSFREQEELRLFMASGSLKSIRHHVEMAFRMAAARPVNVKTGRLNRNAKPIFEQLMGGGLDSGLFSSPESPFQSHEFKEFVQLMKEAQEKEDERLILTPTHDNAYHDALVDIVVPRQEETQTTVRLCHQEVKQVSRDMIELKRLVLENLAAKDRQLEREICRTKRHRERLDKARRRYNAKRRKCHERRPDVNQEESSSVDDSEDEESDDEFLLYKEKPTGVEVSPQLTGAAFAGLKTIVPETIHLPLHRSQDKRAHRVKCGFQRTRRMKTSRHVGKAMNFLNAQCFDQLWKCYFEGIGVTPPYRQLERMGTEWRTDVQKVELNENGKAKKKKVLSNWWYTLQVYFNAFEFLLAGSDDAWDDAKKAPGQGAGLVMEAARAEAEQMWDACPNHSVHTKRKEFKRIFELKLGAKTWKLHGTAYTGHVQQPP